ncbi:MAG TPA: circadian clock protein KaiC [Puia sp.]|nr:circadian clock protein KaiC [Puia sp.]
MNLNNETPTANQKLKKSPTGINGFDEISDGGLPKQRPSIVCGNSGCGKTVLAMEFLVKGAQQYHEPGVFFSFEETREELIANMVSLHFGLEGLIKNKKIYVEYLDLDKSRNIEAGSYGLDGLFVRLQQAIRAVGAKRVAIDSIDALFYGLDHKIVRQEIKRLFKWLKAQKVTAIITSEVDSAIITTDGLEQYVADCVILLNNRVINQTATRRLRIVKMRGSAHGINEYPFIIDSNGISVLPLMSQLANQKFSIKRISSGIDDLDGMLDGKGFFEGSSILVSGSAGTGKTSIAVSLIESTCKKKIRGLYCAFEESADQITRNMRSISLNIAPYVKSGVLKIYSSRPTIQNLELHLISIQKIIEEFKPKIIVLDPVTNLMSEGVNSEIRQMLSHFVDFLKGQNITTLFTAAITLETIKSNPSDEGISAMMDTWILVRDIETNGERNRGIYVLKSRGMNHSTQVREFVITDKGIAFLPIYISHEGVLTGSAKLENTLREEERNVLLRAKIKRDTAELEEKRKILEENITLLKEKFQSETEGLRQMNADNELKSRTDQKNRMEISELRNKTMSSKEKSKRRNK